VKNNRLHVVILLFYLAISLQLGAQGDFNVRYGPQVENDAVTSGDLFTQDSSNYYFLSTSNKEFIEFNTGDDAFIDVFDKDLNHVQSIRLQHHSSEKTKYLQPIEFIKKDGGFLILCKSWSIASKIMKAWLLTVDETGLVETEFKAMGEIYDVEQSMADFHFFAFNTFYHNGELRYLYSISTPPELEINERINFLVFDKDINLRDERLLNFPDDILDYKFSELVVGQSGFVFFGVEIKNPYEPEKTVHQLIVYDVFSDQHKTWEFKPENGEIAKSGLFQLEGDKVGFMGYFTEDVKSDKPTGVFYYIFDAYGGSLLRHNIFELPGQEIAKLDPKNLGSDSEYEHLTPRAMHLSTAGDVVMAYEYNWESMMLLRDQEGILYNHKYYRSNEIVVTHFSPDDRFVNMGIVAKQQILNYGQEHLGFFSLLKDRHLIMIYNDHPKNINVYRGDKIKPMKSRYEPVFTSYNIDNATYKKKPIHKGNNPCACDPNELIRISENAVLFLNKSDEKRLVEIIIN
jgi:hypothetical protein